MIGTEIGTYRIVEKIGEGGMGVVYKAIDTQLDRVVAVKALNPEYSRDPALLERFRGEARAQAKLNHPNLATLYAFLVENGAAYMAMEFVDGETFHAMLARRGPIPAAEAVPLFRQALAGIGHAHRLGIVHRDIKPSNIMLNREGVVKVMESKEPMNWTRPLPSEPRTAEPTAVRALPPNSAEGPPPRTLKGCPLFEEKSKEAASPG